MKDDKLDFNTLTKMHQEDLSNIEQSLLKKYNANILAAKINIGFILVNAVGLAALAVSPIGLVGFSVGLTLAAITAPMAYSEAKKYRDQAAVVRRQMDNNLNDCYVLHEAAVLLQKDNALTPNFVKSLQAAFAKTTPRFRSTATISDQLEAARSTPAKMPEKPVEVTVNVNGNGARKAGRPGV